MDVSSELLRLSQCADIPAYRRRQLLALAVQLRPGVAEPVRRPAEPFADPYYRREGMRLRKPPCNYVSASSATPLLIAVVTQEA